MKSLLAGACVVALWPASAFAQPAYSLAQDAKAFGARPSVKAPDLSADGTHITYLAPGEGRRTIAYVSNIASRKLEVLISSSADPDQLDWCRFVASQRLVCRVSGTLASAGSLIDYGRLMALDSNGENIKPLGQRGSEYDASLRQFDGSVIDWLGSSSNAILMARRYVPEAGRLGTRMVRHKDGLGVDRIDTTSLQVSEVEPAKDFASGYMTDSRGEVRLMAEHQADGAGLLTGKSKYWYRAAGSRKWEGLTDYQEDGLIPLAIDGGIDSLYALKKKDGRWALYTVRLSGGTPTTLVADNPRVDIDDVVRFGDSQRVIGYTFAEGARTTVYFDPEFKALADSLGKALPKLPMISFVDASSDGRKLLVHASSDRDPGRYFLFDRDRKALNELMLDRPELEGRTLAEVRSVSFPAADGTLVPAYLTLPPGRSAKGLPAVVLPHGGPSARDEWGFDWLAQFLAARGHAVIQPNYRGSAGYGDSWMLENGFQSWQTSVGDIVASARWLIAQGIADPNRVAAVGWSYGGYASLQAAATAPDLFKAIAAIAPVTDLGMLKQDAAGYTNRRLTAQFIGSGAHVAEGSPLRRAQAIKVPVLLAHGDRDTNVEIAHSTKMEGALRAAGMPVELLRYRGLDHQLDDSSARTEILTKIGQLLGRTIGK